MLRTLGDWLTWTTTNTTPRDEWVTWEEWQRKQPPAHFEKSDIFQYYMSYRPQFTPPQYAVNTGYQSEYYNYCFGDFAAIIVNPTGGGNIISYLTLLLDVYDICKGMSRRLTGDPTGIALLRQVVNKRSIVPLQSHNFDQYEYDYSVIHAHTVAQYSLSTLLMRLVSHYMSQTCTRGNYSSITVRVCQLASCRSVFGEPKRKFFTNQPVIHRRTDNIKIDDTSPVPPTAQVITKPITIQQKVTSEDPTKEQPHGYSWPRDHATCVRCRICNRICENLWGAFNACLDCHLKRICSICSGTALVMGTDNLPKCMKHHQ